MKIQFYSTLIAIMLFTMHSRLFAQIPPTDIKTFVTRFYIHGVPYDEAKLYGKSAIPQLTQMLKDKTYEQHWPNIVTTLGYIGDPMAVNDLIQFMENSTGEISIYQFRAIIRVFQALGHISQTGDITSLNALKEYTAITSWQKRKLLFKYHQYSNDILGEVLARQAISGLGISGKPDAMKKLNELKLSKDTRADWQDNLQEAIQLNGKVSSQGPHKTFSRSQN